MVGVDCSLTTISNLKPDCHGSTNIIGVVHSTSSIILTKGGDNLCRIHIKDDSTDDIVTCLLFGSLASLPKCNAIPESSILYLRSAKVQYFAGRPQINKSKGYSFAFFHPSEANFSVLDHNLSYTGELSEKEKKRISELRDWLKSPKFCSTKFHQRTASRDAISENRALSNEASEKHSKRLKIAHEQAGESAEEADLEAVADFNLIVNERPVDRFNKFLDFPTPLEKVTLNLYCNLHLQVVGVGQCTRSVVVRCVDGTIPQISTLKISPLHIKSTLSQHVLLQLDQYTVDISVYDDHMNLAKSLLPGDFISVTNVHCYIPYGLNQPEFILHGGRQFNRGIKKLNTSTVTKWMENKIDGIPLEVETSTEICSLEDNPDEPRSVQTSPTECLYPEQTLTSLSRILEKPTDKGLYKVRVYIHRHNPDSYANMIKDTCEQCNSVKSQDSDNCAECSGLLFVKMAYFKFLVRDLSVAEPISVLCFGGQARDFLGVDRINTSFDLEPLCRVVGRWCDLHLLCKVLSEHEVKLMLAHTIVKENTI
ncbi:hypothetical protein ACHWQZ_G010378 [Mnemiopsis leidyi]